MVKDLILLTYIMLHLPSFPIYTVDLMGYLKSETENEFREKSSEDVERQVSKDLVEKTICEE